MGLVSCPLIEGGAGSSGAPDSRWDDELLVSELRQVHGSDFEAVDESSLRVDPDSGQAKQVSFEFFDWLPVVVR